MLKYYITYIKQNIFGGYYVKEFFFVSHPIKLPNFIIYTYLRHFKFTYIILILYIFI
jgi:hypothetical protein